MRSSAPLGLIRPERIAASPHAPPIRDGAHWCRTVRGAVAGCDVVAHLAAVSDVNIVVDDPNISRRHAHV